MKGFVFAAGEGTRLYPVVLEIPKPLLPVNKIPVLTYLIKLYLKHGVNDIKIIIQKKHLEDFHKWRDLSFAKERIDFIIENKPSGTFGALSKIDSNWFSGPIIVSNGDELKEINLKKMMDWHIQKGGVVTIGLVKTDEPQAYGVARIDGDRIIEFIEKPKSPPSNYINSGTYVMEPAIESYYPPKAKFSMVETDLFPKLAKEEKLYGYKFKGRWQDIGTFKRWEEAIKTWNRKN
jgi:mannose-1-phosphate guanylyltransferase/phosphomannomutase